MEDRSKKLKPLVWHIEKRKVKDLIHFEGNPRKMTKKQVEDLKKSLEKFNLVEIPAIDLDNKIIAGHQRLKVLMLLGRGEEEIDVRVPNRKLTEEEFKEYNLRSNKNTGEWDFDLLANFDENLLQEVGFESEELDEIFGLEMVDEFDEEKEYKKVVKEPRGCKIGDIWQLGDHKLAIGSATDKDVWARLLNGEKYDFLFTDPPYKLAYSKKRTRKVKTKEGWKNKRQRVYQPVGDTDKQGKPITKGFGYKGNRAYEGVEITGGVPEYDEWLSIANEYQNPKGVNVMVFENWKNTRELWNAIEKYWKVKNMVIWYLPNRHQGWSKEYDFFNKYDIAPLAGDGESNEEHEEELENYLKEKGQKLLDTYEIILYAQKGKSEWSKKKGSKWGRISDHITWVAETEKSSGQNLIFGTKPIQILVPYIKILSPREGIVVDCFAGSGSTIIASEIMRRRCRAIELSPIYSEVILNRWEKFTGKKAIKLT